MNYKKHKHNIKHFNNNKSLTNSNMSQSVANNNGKLFNSINLSNQPNYQLKKILCIFQKTSLGEKSIGISHTEINLAEGETIYTGDYPLYEIDSFELFLANYQPDIVLLHSNPEHKISQIFSNESFESKVKQIPFISIQHKTMTQLLHEYYSSKLNVSQVCIYTKVSQIVSSLSISAITAMYMIFNLVIKHQSSLSDGLMHNDIITFQRKLFNDVLFITSKTQKELKVFEEKLHPSLVKGQGKSKEGLSLFNLFNKCLTSQGKKLLKTFFLFPLQNEDKITQRYDCINAFISMTSFGFAKSIIAELNKIKDLEIIIKDLQKFIINFKVWKNIFFSFNSILKIFELFKGKNEQFKLLGDILTRVNQENIEKVYAFVCNCLEITKEDIRPKIKTGINEVLDQLKGEYSGIDELLSKYAIEYSKKIPKDSFMEKYMYVFIPQLGYMLAIEKNAKYKDFITKAYLKYCKNQFIPNEDQEIDTIKFRIKQYADNNENDYRERQNCETNLRSHSDAKKGAKESYNQRSKNKDSDPFDTNVHNIIYNNHNIIEEEDDISQNDDYNIKNRNLTMNMNISQNNNNNNESDDEEYELRNYEETLMLQGITFTDLEIQFQFHSNEMIYFKNEKTNQLDKDYGDLAARITDVENAIYREISKQILEFESDILITNDFISHLDVFINLYLLSERYCLSRPIIANSFSFHSNNPDSNNSTNNNVKSKIIKSSLSFEDARNLITELANESKYIKNSFHSENKSLFIISGHVSSGKSVYLRMIGMMVYLAQIGCYVPSKVFCYDIFTKILSNIEIFESSVDHMSGFTLEIKELKIIIDIITDTFTKDNKEDDIEDNLLVLFDDPFKRSSIHNQNCLIAGVIQHITSLLINNRNKTKKMKMFVCLSNESKDFLVKHNLINNDITLCYETNTIINNGVMVNLFSLKPILPDNNKNNNSKRNLRLKGEGCKLLIAKENGLDNQLFLRSLEILNVIKSNTILFPNIAKVSKITQRFLINKNNIKESLLMSNIQMPNLMSMPNMINPPLVNNQLNEDVLFNQLNQLFI